MRGEERRGEEGDKEHVIEVERERERERERGGQQMLRLKMFFCSFFEFSFHLHVCMPTTC